MHNQGMPRTAKSVQAASAKSARSRTLAAPKLTRDTGEPLYRQVVQSLRGDILRGAYRVGSQLPTEEELTARFSVSRHTVREALRQLRADGLVSSRQGSGTTVMPPQPSTPFNVHRVASIDELIAYAAESRYVVEHSDIVTSEEVATADLQLPAGRSWLRLRGIRLGDEPAAPPICWTEVFVAAAYAGVERLIGRQQGPIWRLIEDMYGERLVEVEQSLRVCPVPDDIAAALGIEPGSSVVEVLRTYKTTSDGVAEVAVNLYPADKFRFNMKLRRA